MIPTKATKKSPYKSKNIFNYSSQPVFPIEIDQSLTITSMQISQYGRMGGVIFIQTPKGSFALKANNQTAQNVFYNQLALMLDINVPQMTAIACYDPQFTRIVYLIQKYCHEDQVLYARLKSKLDFPFYSLMEYIPSVLPIHFGKNKFSKHMTSDYKLYSIGMALAYDILINNGDRFKLLWGGSGNLNNVLIQIVNIQKQTQQKAKDREDDTVSFGNFAFVDNQGYMIDPSNINAKKNVQTYMQKATQFQLNMIQYLRQQNSQLPQQFQKITKQIYEQTQYKFTDQDIVKICEGIVYSTKKFIISYENQEIKNLYESIPKPTDTKKKQVNYWNEYWNNLFKKVSLLYSQLFYIKISAIYTTYPELINEIYQRVKKCVDENKNKRKRRVSKGSRKNSQMSSNQNLNQNGEGNGEGQQNNEQKSDKPKEDEQEQESQSKRKRKWREKLQVFRKQNYRE